jgi:hypothetical protein
MTGFLIGFFVLLTKQNSAKLQEIFCISFDACVMCVYWNIIQVSQHEAVPFLVPFHLFYDERLRYDASSDYSICAFFFFIVSNIV